MKTISLWQPWATLWVLQIKKYETRSWTCPAGMAHEPTAIHAAKKKVNLMAVCGYSWMQEIRSLLSAAGHNLDALPLGAVIGRCDGLKSTPITGPNADRVENMLGLWSADRYAWSPERMRPIEKPIPVKGMQRIFNIPDRVFSEPSQASAQMSLF